MLNPMKSKKTPTGELIQQYDPTEHTGMLSDKHTSCRRREFSPCYLPDSLMESDQHIRNITGFITFWVLLCATHSIHSVTNSDKSSCQWFQQHSITLTGNKKSLLCVCTFRIHFFCEKTGTAQAFYHQSIGMDS